jgi:hypothetical protein
MKVNSLNQPVMNLLLYLKHLPRLIKSIMGDRTQTRTSVASRAAQEIGLYNGNRWLP